MPKTPSTADQKRSIRRSLAVRLSEEDWEFLDSQPGSNPSEELRDVIARARLQAQRPATTPDAQLRLHPYIDHALQGLQTPPRSIVAEDILREAQLILATAMVGPPQPGFEDACARQAFEAQIVDRAFDLLDALLRHSLTPNAAAWNPDVIRARLLGSKELLVSALSSVARDNPPKSSEAP